MAFREKLLEHNPSRTEPLVPVGRRQYEQALKRLRSHSDFDIDALLKEDAEALLLRPLGPSPQCLSVAEIADFRLADRDRRIAAERVSWIQLHLPYCAECRGYVELYQELLSSAELRAHRAAACAGSIPLESRVEEPVDLDAEDLGHVTFVLVVRHAGAERMAEAESLVVRGVLSGRSDSLRRIEGTVEREDEAAYEVSLRVEATDLPSLPEGPILDWLKFEGRLADGQPFSSRSLVCLRQASMVGAS